MFSQDFRNHGCLLFSLLDMHTHIQNTVQLFSILYLVKIWIRIKKLICFQFISIFQGCHGPGPRPSKYWRGVVFYLASTTDSFIPPSNLPQCVQVWGHLGQQTVGIKHSSNTGQAYIKKILGMKKGQKVEKHQDKILSIFAYLDHESLPNPWESGKVILIDGVSIISLAHFEAIKYETINDLLSFNGWIFT